MIPPGYRGHAELVTRLRAAGGVELGRSVDGAPILAVAIGPAEATRLSVVIAGLHPIEWIGVETALSLIDRLAARPPTDRRVLAIALANPDGYQRVEADLRAGRRRYHRTNSRGVDLNRNWPTAFLRRPAWLPGWPGAHPASEPEIAAIVQLLDREVARGSRVDTALSLHSFGRKLLIPDGARFRRPARYAELHERAQRVRDRLVEPYTISQVSHWVPGAFVHGMEIDDLHHRYGACALLVECGFGGGLTLDPERWLTPFHWYNPRRPSRMAGELARALEPFVRGT